MNRWSKVPECSNLKAHFQVTIFHLILSQNCHTITQFISIYLLFNEYNMKLWHCMCKIKRNDGFHVKNIEKISQKTVWSISIVFVGSIVFWSTGYCYRWWRCVMEELCWRRWLVQWLTDAFGLGCDFRNRVKYPGVSFFFTSLPWGNQKYMGRRFEPVPLSIRGSERAFWSGTAGFLRDFWCLTHILKKDFMACRRWNNLL